MIWLEVTGWAVNVTIVAAFLVFLWGQWRI